MFNRIPQSPNFSPDGSAKPRITLTMVANLVSGYEDLKRTAGQMHNRIQYAIAT